MSLNIEPDRVEEVLLADGWHAVARRTFALDAYEFVDGDEVLHGAGTGFSFVEDIDPGQVIVSGPLTSVLAVREST